MKCKLAEARVLEKSKDVTVICPNRSEVIDITEMMRHQLKV
ncbi:hypothetical protein [Mesohalobacter halotolerans]|nr:hypothetical protein [Mesohalobacter halotolerans]